MYHATDSLVPDPSAWPQLIAAIMTALDRLPFGLVIVVRGRLLLANTTANEMLKSDPHLWNQIIARTVEHGAVTVTARGGQPTTFALPVSPRSGELTACFLIDPSRPAPVNLDLIRLVYNLTKAEASLAHMLLNGTGVEDAAEKLHVSNHTVRSHLKRPFAKTGTKTQAQLLRLLIRSGALLTTGPCSTPQAREQGDTCLTDISKNHSNE